MKEPLKTATIAFRIEQSIKEKLQAEAQKDRRSLSRYIEITLLNHLDNLAATAKVQDETLHKS